MLKYLPGNGKNNKNRDCKISFFSYKSSKLFKKDF